MFLRDFVHGYVDTREAWTPGTEELVRNRRPGRRQGGCARWRRAPHCGVIYLIMRYAARGVYVSDPVRLALTVSTGMTAWITTDYYVAAQGGSGLVVYSGQ